jgi:hypothetical protein
MQVIYQRRKPRETLRTKKLLMIQRTIGLPEDDMAFGWNLAHTLIYRHNADLDINNSSKIIDLHSDYI